MMKLLEKLNIFEAETNGYRIYRVPGIIQSRERTFLLYCEGRAGGRDWGDIDIVYRIYERGLGATRQDTLVHISPEFPRNPISISKGLSKGGVAANNPVMINDGKLVHFLYCVDYYRCFYKKSENCGYTFSKPVEITDTFERFRHEYDWKILATGPGHGIRNIDGRLIVPVWISLGHGTIGHRPSRIGTIYSEDGGMTWNAGELIGEDPLFQNPSECCLARVSNGVLMSVRHEGPVMKHAFAFSEDGISNWKYYLTMNEPEPVCMSSIVYDTHTDSIYLAMLSTKNPRDRRNLTLWRNTGELDSWENLGSIEPGPCGYADIVFDNESRHLLCLYCHGAITVNAFKPEAIRMVRIDP